MSDKQIKTGLILYIIVSLILFTGGLVKYIPVLYLSILNILSASGLVIPWIQKYLRYPHRIETLEIVFLCVECLFVIASIFCVVVVADGGWLIVSQYTIAALNLLAAIAFFIFILLFKIKKLF
ncbi:MAG: hypothetical protein ABJB86_00180 [Bacteroidota bacterium]